MSEEKSEEGIEFDIDDYSKTLPKKSFMKST